MKRIDPYPKLEGYPCSITALTCALKKFPDGMPEYYNQLGSDGYATLNAANKFFRKNIQIKKRTDYRRGERPKLKDLKLNGSALICVRGHYIYLDKNGDYWSFFDNENDEVITIWEILS